MAKSELTHQNIPVGDSSLHIVEAGHDHPDSMVFLHGWPEDWTEWQRIMEQASKTHHVIAETIHQAIQALGFNTYTIVGHDVGAKVKQTKCLGLFTFPKRKQMNLLPQHHVSQ